jgi:hypothetical protein
MYSLTSGTGIVTSGTTTTGVYDATPIVTTLPFSVDTAISHSLYIDSNNSTINNMNKVQNQFVAIFKIERNDKNEITSAKFIKEMWIETKNGSSVDFEVARDPEISKYKADEISIRTIYTVTF